MNLRQLLADSLNKLMLMKKTTKKKKLKAQTKKLKLALLISVLHTSV